MKNSGLMISKNISIDQTTSSFDVLDSLYIWGGKVSDKSISVYIQTNTPSLNKAIAAVSTCCGYI